MEPRAEGLSPPVDRHQRPDGLLKRRAHRGARSEAGLDRAANLEYRLDANEPGRQMRHLSEPDTVRAHPPVESACGRQLGCLQAYRRSFTRAPARMPATPR